MLSHLSISHYTIAEALEIELHDGMTVITGETGAGKSIMLDALGLALGDRADAGIVRPGADKAEIHALFDITDIDPARNWLTERDLLAGEECMLRRVITREGRSRGYINGQPATLQDIRELGSHLIDIHNQHEHQSLLKKDQQRLMLDAYAGIGQLSETLADCARAYQQSSRQLQTLLDQRDEQSARGQLLRYQLEELDRLAITEGEVEALESERKQLAHAEDILASGHHAIALCKEGEVNALGILHQALSSLRSDDFQNERLRSAQEMLDNALIQVDEAVTELQHHVDSVELDPERLQLVEARLDDIYQVARKHRIKPEQLPELHRELQEELDGLEGSDERIQALETEMNNQLEDYQQLAAKVSKKRQQSAKKLCQQVEKQLATLAMANCRFEVALKPRDSEQPHPQGCEDVEFLVSTNPGAKAGPLNRIASGGELSRISLAIQVITAQVTTVPTMIFDEVDVGIGGATAEIVGKLLHTLGQNCQVLCVTHQPQVASKGDHHLRVQKTSTKSSVRTELERLSDGEKIDEIARMLGGIAITESTLAHAREMVDTRH